ncbi:MAG: citrate lyase holo-[Oscillibacter sp.]|nr:citrate lyase holo-[acyl-carrier protein] synthase [Oscillibacter sp.]
MIDPHFLEGQEAALPQILSRREARVCAQQALLGQGGRCLVSFSMNIPGQRKQFLLAHESFKEGLSLLLDRFSSHLLTHRLFSASTGDEALLLLDLKPEQAKAITTTLEESHPLGRLWDMDVLDRNGSSLSRTALGYPARRCLICDAPAKECGRSRRHSYEDLFLRAGTIMHDYFRSREAQRVGRCAVQAVVTEVSVTPKPGLVDRRDSGSHSDMDFFTFLNSAAALSPWFPRFFRAGWDHREGLFPVLRSMGLQAEKEMFAATGGINTHKGLIFSMSILCAALGRACAQNFPNRPDRETVVGIARILGQASLQDFSGSSPSTAGLRCHQQHGALGIRGEAAAGFPAVFTLGLPTLKCWLDLGCSLNDSAAATLIALIAEVEDTNMIHRGGRSEALARQKEASELRLTPENLTAELEKLNEEYILCNLSPGGCADLLALTLFLYFLEQ